MLKEIRLKYESKNGGYNSKSLSYIKSIKKLLEIDGLDIIKENNYVVVFCYGGNEVEWKYKFKSINQIRTYNGWINVEYNDFKKYLRWISNPKIIKFGKHKGKTLGYIRTKEPNYYKWCLKNINGFDKPFKIKKNN